MSKQARQELAQQKGLAGRVLKADVEPVLLRARIGELEDELETVAKVRDAWCAEYTLVRDALKGLLLCLEGEFDGEKLAQATNRATAAMGRA